MEPIKHFDIGRRLFLIRHKVPNTLNSDKTQSMFCFYSTWLVFEPSSFGLHLIQDDRRLTRAIYDHI